MIWIKKDKKGTSCDFMWLHRMHHYFPSPVKFSTGSRWVTGTQPVVTERLLLLTPRSFLPLSVHDSIIQTSSLCKKWNIQKDWEKEKGDEELTPLCCWFPIYSASLIAQLVKNPPAMKETSVWFLGQKDSLEKG